MTDRDLSKLKGDELTWALHAENESKLTTLDAKLNLVLGFLSIGSLLFATALGWLFMKGG